VQLGKSKERRNKPPRPETIEENCSGCHTWSRHLVSVQNELKEEMTGMPMAGNKVQTGF
jgi:hypothetical protein